MLKYTNTNPAFSFTDPLTDPLSSFKGQDLTPYLEDKDSVSIKAPEYGAPYSPTYSRAQSSVPAPQQNNNQNNDDQSTEQAVINTMDIYDSPLDISTMDIYEGAAPAISSMEILGAEPDYTPSDPGFKNQWHINSHSQSANVMDVWDEYRGDGVKIAILDDGIDTQHRDLSANYNHSLSYDYALGRTGAHISSWSKHGTAVGGVIAADNNGVGAVGVAPDADLIGYKIDFSNVSFSQLTHAFGKARNDADVLNNSWSFNTMFADNKLSSGYSSFFNAIEGMARYGRDGLGTVVVNSAGNSRASGDNVNHHNFQNSPYTIAVGAIDSNGTYSSFSTPGAAVLISAPGRSIYTTDVTGSGGYSSGDYVSINGTSFSAPIVSGVVGLMLEANPNLGYRDVQEILAYSARNSHTSFNDWQTNGASNFNNGGLTFSHQYGFGAVDAHAAVRLAESWHKQSTFSNMETASYSRNVNAHIPDQRTVSSSISVSKDMDIQHVLVTVDISHARVGHLQLKLISPDGTQSLLLDNPGTAGSGSGSSSSFQKFEFSTVAHWGESSQGQWTLEVYDRISGTTGTLKNWSIKFLGDQPTDDNTYFYTNEYAKVNNGSVLTDRSDGTHTINAAAVTSNSIIDLTGGNGRIAGQSFRVDSGTEISNVIAGDGNDTIRGNDAGNYIYGGRGNDTIYGSAGNDTLDGGKGTNTVIYSQNLSNFGIQIVSDAEIVVSSAATGIDKLLNFSWFSFGGNTYNYQDMVNYANNGSTPPPQEPPPEEPEEPQEPEEPEEPPQEPEQPGEAAPPISLTFAVTTETGSNINLRATSDEYTTSVLSSAEMRVGSATNDAALTVERSPEEMIFTGGDHVADQLRQLTVSTRESAHYEVTNFRALRLDGRYADGSITLSAEDIQSGLVYTSTGGGNDTLDISVTNHDGSSSSSANTLTIRSYGGDDTITVTGDNPHFRSNVNLGSGNNTYKSSVDGAEAIRMSNGNNTVETAGGDDTIYGGGGDDVLRSSGGNNRLYGGAGDDVLFGGSGNDLLDGGSGNDILHTSAGNNTLRGGSGADTFVVLNVTGKNQVLDFNRADGDSLDLSAVLANFNPNSDNIHNFLRVDYNSSSRYTELGFNVSGTGSQFVNMIELRGIHSFEDILEYAGLGDIPADDPQEPPQEPPPEEPEEPEEPENPEQPPEQPPGDPAAPIDLTFRVIDSNGNLRSYRTSSEESGTTTLSSAELGIGTATNDAALTITRSDDVLKITGGSHVSGKINDLIMTTDVPVSYEVSGVTRLRVNGQEIEGGYDMTATDVQSGLLYGSDGNDTLALDVRNVDGNSSSSANYLRLSMGEGDNVVTVDGNNPYFRSVVEFGDGNNVYKSSVDGTETIRTGDGDNIIETAGGDDRLYGGAGNDILRSTSGNNRLYGGDGDDMLYGGSGDDLLYGEAGDDVLFASEGSNRLFGGAGADTFVLLDVNGTNRIEDFSLSDGDRLDISDLLSGFDSSKDALSDFLILEYNRSLRATEVKIDSGDGNGFEIRAEMRGDHSALDVNQLYQDGHIINNGEFV